MKDINGVELERGDTIVGDVNEFRMVIGFHSGKMITSYNVKIEEELKNYHRKGTTSWTQEEITRCKLKIIKRRLLGVYDSTGREYRVGDKTECGHIVFDAIKSRNNDDMDYVLYESEDGYGGWSYGKSTCFTIISSYPHEPVRLKVGITVDGKPLELPLDVARARELGVVE